MKTLSFIIATLFINFAFAGSIADLLEKNTALYRTRFDSSGNYIKDPNARDAFIAKQNETIQLLKNGKNITKSFNLTNSRSSTVVGVFLVEENNGEFAGVYIQKSAFEDREDEGNLYLYSKGVLNAGMDVIQRDNKRVINIQSVQGSGDGSLLINVLYPRSFKKQDFNTYTITVKKAADNRLEIYQPSGVKQGNIHLKIKISILKMDFSIELEQLQNQVEPDSSETEIEV